MAKVLFKPSDLERKNDIVDSFSGGRQADCSLPVTCGADGSTFSLGEKKSRVYRSTSHPSAPCAVYNGFSPEQNNPVIVREKHTTADEGQKPGRHSSPHLYLDACHAFFLPTQELGGHNYLQNFGETPSLRTTVSVN